MTRSICFLSLLLSLSVIGGPSPLGNKDAPKGGTFVVGFPGYPKHLQYYLANDELASGVNGVVLESLMEVSPETYELMPLLATDWSVSADKRIFTVKISPQARFSDGKPVTAEDVKFTWDTIMNPKNKTAPFQSYFSSFEACTVIDSLTVQFKAKTLHFKNLRKISDLLILPKHFYSDGDFNKAFNDRILGSGPYTLEKAETGLQITMKRNPDYWGAKLPQNIGRYNFDRIVFKAVPDYNVQFEMFKRGDIDYFYFLVSKMWATETDGPLFKKSYIRKLKAENRIQYGTQGIAWNLRKPMFQDRRVRLALSHLMNREKYIKDLFYSNYVPATGVVGTTSEYHSPKVKPIPYDPKKARELLKAAGWAQVGSDGVLTKESQRFEFDVLTSNPASQRYLTVYQEDLKQMGIKMNIRTQDWTTMLKLVDDRQFDAAEVNRGRDIEPSDYAVMWSSKEADIKGSANLTGYKNPELDDLAQKIDESFDKKVRLPLVRRLEEILSADQPLSFAWEPTYFRLAHWNKFSFPKKGYFNYSAWRDAFHYWWLDAEKEAKLKKAMQSGEPLS